MRSWSYTEYKLGTQFTREQFKTEFGPSATFPQVLINGQKMGGCTETIKFLREGAYL